MLFVWSSCYEEQLLPGPVVQDFKAQDAVHAIAGNPFPRTSRRRSRHLAPRLGCIAYQRSAPVVASPSVPNDARATVCQPCGLENSSSAGRAFRTWRIRLLLGVYFSEKRPKKCMSKTKRGALVSSASATSRAGR